MKKSARRWGYFEILLHGKGFWIKRLIFKGGSTSYQSHKKRDELWVIRVPHGVKHRISGQGQMIEIAIGDPKERDIVRHEK